MFFFSSKVVGSSGSVMNQFFMLDGLTKLEILAAKSGRDEVRCLAKEMLDFVSKYKNESGRNDNSDVDMIREGVKEAGDSQSSVLGLPPSNVMIAGGGIPSTFHSYVPPASLSSMSFPKLSPTSSPSSTLFNSQNQSQTLPNVFSSPLLPSSSLYTTPQKGTASDGSDASSPFYVQNDVFSFGLSPQTQQLPQPAFSSPFASQTFQSNNSDVSGKFPNM
jgi:hypothetical protein